MCLLLLPVAIIGLIALGILAVLTRIPASPLAALAIIILGAILVAIGVTMLLKL
jgi:uncharacterized protein (DUF58 family)